MRKWMKMLSGLMLSGLVLALIGNVCVYADTTEEEKEVGIQSIYSVSYNGDPVYYDGDISASDFRVRVRYTDGTTKYLGEGEFDISPSVMGATRNYEKVTVTVDGVNGDLEKTVRVKSAGPVLVSIEASYEGDDLIVGGVVDRDDVEVIAYYNDGSDKTVSGWEFEDGDYDDLDVGANYITISYEQDDEFREEDDITVYAYDGDLESISATYNGVIINVGGTVLKNYIKVMGVYDTGRGEVTQRLYDFYIEDYNIKEGNNTLTVYYREGRETYEDTIIVKGALPAGSTSTTTIPTGAGVWELTNGIWRYKENGVYIANRWVQSPDSGLWYWMEADGTMAANTWHNDGGTWYWLNADGSMATGWVFVAGQWYYMDDINGNMRVGWKWYNGVCYYLDPITGAMATNRWIGSYYVNGTGAWDPSIIR